MADMEAIAAQHALFAGITMEDILGMSRVPRYSYPRQAAMKAMRDAGYTWVAIGQYLGGRHEDTIVKGVRAHKARNGK